MLTKRQVVFVSLAMVALLISFSLLFSTDRGDDETPLSVAENDLPVETSDGVAGPESELQRAKAPRSSLNEESVANFLAEVTEHKDIILLIDDLALQKEYSDYDYARGLAFWSTPCELVNPTVEADTFLRNAVSSESDLVTALDSFCKSYTQAVADSINDLLDAPAGEAVQDDHAQVLLEEFSRLSTTASREDALEFFWSAVYQSLEAFRFDQVLDLYWQLHFSEVFQVEGQLYSSISETTELSVVPALAAATAIMCSRIGGCSDNHPLLINLCLFGRDRPCPPPLQTYKTIGDMLTGIEVIYYNQLLMRTEAGMLEVSG